MKKEKDLVQNQTDIETNDNLTIDKTMTPINDKQYGKIYTFWSPQVGSGCTFLALQTAKKLASMGYKTILVDFDLRTPVLSRDLNAKDTMHYLDNILPNALSKNIPMELLRSYCLEKGENLYFFAGIENPDLALDVEPEGLEYILSLLKGEFEYIIIDTNSYIDNAGTFVGLLKADKVLLPIEKKYQSLRSYEYAKNFVENDRIIDFNKFELVLNKVEKSILLSSSEVENFFGKSSSIEISNLGADYINDDNIGRGEEFLRSSKKATTFHEDMEKLVNAYIELPETEDTKAKTKKRGLFGKGK